MRKQTISDTLRKTIRDQGLTAYGLARRAGVSVDRQARADLKAPAEGTAAMKRKIDFTAETERCAYRKHWPYHLQYKMLRCITPDCPGNGIKSPTIEAFNLRQRRIVCASVKICRELGILEEGV